MDAGNESENVPPPSSSATDSADVKYKLQAMKWGALPTQPDVP